MIHILLKETLLKALIKEGYNAETASTSHDATYIRINLMPTHLSITHIRIDHTHTTIPPAIINNADPNYIQKILDALADQ